MESHKISQHSTGLVEGTITIIFTHAILLEEIVFEHPGNFKCNLVILAQCTLSNQLYNFGQILFLLKDLLRLCSELDESGFFALIVRFKDFSVFGVRYTPVNGWEVFALRELLVETPEDLDDTECCSCDRVREIATRRRHTESVVRGCAGLGI